MKNNIDTTTRLPVLVPKKSGFLGIKDGSAIVVIQRDALHRIYYEGNVYGAENLKSIEGRLKVAASRALYSAPTIACMGLSQEDFQAHFTQIGSYQYSTNTLLVDKTQTDIWQQWLKADESLAA